MNCRASYDLSGEAWEVRSSAIHRASPPAGCHQPDQAAAKRRITALSSPRSQMDWCEGSATLCWLVRYAMVGRRCGTGAMEQKETKALKPAELVAEAISLPVEERAAVAESILRSLNPPESDTDRKWAEVARRRLAELRSGHVQAVPGDEVFARIWKRFGV
jgi:putative addiction module component (TIGR02574 family)